MKILFVQNNNFSDKYFFQHFHFLTEIILFIDKRIFCVIFYFQVKIIFENRKEVNRKEVKKRKINRSKSAKRKIN